MSNKKATLHQINSIAEVLSGEKTVDQIQKPVTPLSFDQLKAQIFADVKSEKAFDYVDQQYYETINDISYRVNFCYLGEGLSGDYDSEDPNDLPLLRFDVDISSDEYHEKWEELGEASWCTTLPITTPKWMLDVAAKTIFDTIKNSSSLDPLSHFCLDDFKSTYEKMDFAVTTPKKLKKFKKAKFILEDEVTEKEVEVSVYVDDAGCLVVKPSVGYEMKLTMYEGALNIT